MLAKTTVSKDNSLAGVKAAIEATNALDAAALPPHLVCLPLLAAWLGKAIAAREASIAYFLETKAQQLETVA